MENLQGGVWEPEEHMIHLDYEEALLREAKIKQEDTFSYR